MGVQTGYSEDALGNVLGQGFLTKHHRTLMTTVISGGARFMVSFVVQDRMRDHSQWRGASRPGVSGGQGWRSWALRTEVSLPGHY